MIENYNNILEINYKVPYNIQEYILIQMEDQKQQMEK